MLDRCLPWFVARAPCVPGAELPLILQKLMVVVPGTVGLPPPRGGSGSECPGKGRRKKDGWSRQGSRINVFGLEGI